MCPGAHPSHNTYPSEFAVCLTPSRSNSSGALHLARPIYLREGTRPLHLHARMGSGTPRELSSYTPTQTTGGGFAFALHTVGPLLDPAATGFTPGLFQSIWLRAAPALLVLFDASGEAAMAGGGRPAQSMVSIVAEYGGGERYGLGSAPANFSFGAPESWWGAWLDVDPVAGTAEVSLAFESDTKPDSPVLSANLNSSAQSLKPLFNSTWVSVGAVSGCSELVIVVDAGFWPKEYPYNLSNTALGSPPGVPTDPDPQQDLATAVSVVVRGVEYRFGFRPGVDNGAAQIVGPNGPLFTGASMGWTPAQEIYHKLTIVLRASGMHTFRIDEGEYMSGRAAQTWERDFRADGWWHGEQAGPDSLYLLPDGPSGSAVDGSDEAGHKWWVSSSQPRRSGYIQIVGTWWTPGGSPLSEFDTVATVADEMRYDTHATAANDWHKAKLRHRACHGAEHRLGAVSVWAGDETAPVSETALVHTALELSGDSRTYMHSHVDGWFPSEQITVEFWIRPSDPLSSSQAGILSYSAYDTALSEPPGLSFGIFDGGGYYKANIEQHPWTVTTPDAWAPVGPLTTYSRGVRCTNYASGADHLGGGPFSTQAACDLWCAASPQCAACSPANCRITNETGCRCQWRALRQCPSTESAQAGCAAHAISAKSAGWAHFAFRWRSSDGCGAFLRDGVVTDSFCAQAQGVEIRPDGVLALGQLTDAPNSVVSGYSFSGSLAEVRVWDAYLSTDQVRGCHSATTATAFASVPTVDGVLLAAAWTMHNSAGTDVSGNERHLEQTGFPSWAGSGPNTLQLDYLSGSCGAAATPAPTPQPTDAAQVETLLLIEPLQMTRLREGAVASVRPGDIDGDGDADLLLCLESGDVEWLEAPEWQRHTVGAVDPAAGAHAGVEAADVDGDGDQDALLAAGGAVWWWENVDGKGTFAPRVLRPSPAPPAALIGACAADLDGDGVTDIVATLADDATAPSPFPSTAAVDAELVLRLALDGDLSDSSGLGRDGAGGQSLEYARGDGLGGASLSLDGSSQCALGPRGDRLVQSATQLTWMLWFKADYAPAPNERVLFGSFSGNDSDGLYEDTGGAWSVQLNGTSLACHVAYSNTPTFAQGTVAHDVWQRATCVWDGVAGTLSAYSTASSGVETRSLSALVGTVTGAPYSVSVGCASRVSWGGYFAGLIDDVRLWTAALSEAQALRQAAALVLPLDGAFSDLSLLRHPVYESAATGLLWGSGVRGGALAMSGYSVAYGPSARALLPDGTQCATLGVWLLPQGEDAEREALGTEDGKLLIGRTAYGEAFCTAGSVTVTAGAQSMPVGEWRHVVCVLDGEAQTASVYVDGVHHGTLPGAGRSLNVSSAFFVIGGATPTGSRWRGMLDEVVVIPGACPSPAAFGELFATPRSPLVFHHPEELPLPATGTAGHALPPLPVAGRSPRAVATWARHFWEPRQNLTTDVACFASLGGTQSGRVFAVCIDLHAPAVIIDDGGDNTWNFTVPELSVAVWHHVAVSYDGAYLRAWFDGAPLPCGSCSAGPVLAVAASLDTQWSNELVDGRAGAAAGQQRRFLPMRGALRDLRVYRTALSDADAAALYAGRGALWFRGLGDGEFERAGAGGGAGPRVSGVTAQSLCRDWDGDGDADVGTVSQHGGRGASALGVLLNDGAGGLPTAVAVDATPAQYSLAAAFHPDGAGEELVAGRSDGAVVRLPLRLSPLGIGAARAVVSAPWSCGGIAEAGLCDLRHGAYDRAAGELLALDAAQQHRAHRTPVGGSRRPALLDAAPAGAAAGGCFLEGAGAVFASPRGLWIAPSPEAAAAAADRAPAPAADGAALHLQLNEGGGRSARDASPNGLHGLLQGAATWTADAAAGPSAVLLPEGGWLSAGPAARLGGLAPGGTPHLTVSLWVRRDQLPGEAPLVTSAGSFVMRVTVAGRLKGDVRPEPPFCATPLSASPVGTREWHHVAMVFQDDEAVDPDLRRVVRLFIDGRQLASCGGGFPAERPAAVLLAPQGEVRVGGGVFSGAVDDLRIDLTALSALRLAAMARAQQAAVPRFSPAPTSCPPGWESRSGGDASAPTCVRVWHGPRRRDQARGLCSRHACIWDYLDGWLSADAAPERPQAADEEDCRRLCCAAWDCRAAVWSGTSCSLYPNATTFHVAAQYNGSVSLEVAEKAQVWFPQRGAAHGWDFDDADSPFGDLVEQAAVNSTLSSYSDTRDVLPATWERAVVLTEGRSGRGAELREGGELRAELYYTAVPSQAWTLSGWVRFAGGSPTAPRCHFSVEPGDRNGSFAICDDATGAFVVTPGGGDTPSGAVNLTMHAAAGTPRSDWHLWEMAFDGETLRLSRDCAPVASVDVGSPDTGHPLAALSVGAAAGSYRGGVWRYDSVFLLGHFECPCGDTSCTNSSRAAPPRHPASGLAAARGAGGRRWVAGQAAATGGAWVSSESPEEACSDGTAPAAAVSGDGAERCGGRRERRAAVCEQPQAAADAGAAAAPVLFANGLFSAAPEEREWVLLVRQPRGTLFPAGRYLRFGSRSAARAAPFAELGADWDGEFRNGDGALELRLRWPRGDCGGAAWRGDLVWLQRSPPTAHNAVRGFRLLRGSAGADFKGLARSSASAALLSTPGSGGALYAVGSTAAQGCGVAVSAGVYGEEVELWIRRPPQRRPSPGRLSVALWIRARREHGGFSWAAGKPSASGQPCPGPRCGCDSAAAVSGGADGGRGAAMAGCLQAPGGCEEATLSHARGVSRGTAWVCGRRSGAGADGDPEFARMRPATRRYGVFSYWTPTAPALGLSCEGARPGRCELLLGEGGTDDGPVNAGELLRNAWGDNEWVHFAATWEAQRGCWAAYLDGAVVQSGCGHNDGASVPPGGEFVLGRHMLAAGVADPDGALDGAVSDVAVWSRDLPAAEVARVAGGAAAAGPALEGSWPLRMPAPLRGSPPLRRRGGGWFEAYEAAPPEGRGGAGARLRMGAVPERSLDAPVSAFPPTAAADSDGITVTLWQRSAAPSRALLSFAPQGAWVPQVALACREAAARCSWEVASAGPDAVTFADTGAGGEWVHVAASFRRGAALVYLGGAPVEAAVGSPLALDPAGVQASSGPGPERAADSVQLSNGTFSSAVCWESNATETNATWWRADLGEARWVSAVRVSPGSGGCCRDSTVSVHVGDHGDERDPQCGASRPGMLSVASAREFQCAEGARGRYVQVRGSLGLALCEVGVMSPAPVRRVPASGLLRLGGYPGDPALAFAGALAEVGVWGRALGRRDIVAAMGDAAPAPPAPVAFWPLSDLSSADGAASQDMVAGHAAAAAGVHGRWALAARQVFPGAPFGAGEWERGTQSDTSEARLGRFAAEHRLADGRLVLRMMWPADDPSGAHTQTWAQVSDPTAWGAPAGVYGGDLGGLSRDAAQGMALTAANSSGEPLYAVGTFSGVASRVASWGAASVAAAELQVLGGDLCRDEWDTADGWACGSHYTPLYHAGSAAYCQRRCRELPGCTGFSMGPARCLLHYPPAWGDPAVAFTVGGAAVGTQVLYEGAPIWSDAYANATGVPAEMLGAVTIYSAQSIATGTLVTVGVDRAAWLFVVCTLAAPGGWETRLSAGDGWEGVDSGTPWWDGSGTTFGRRRLLRDGDSVALPATTTAANCIIAVRAADAGALDAGDCAPIAQGDSAMWRLRRECAAGASAAPVGEGQCRPSADGRCGGGWGEPCLPSSGLASGGARGCLVACMRDGGCSYFTAHSDGWCSLHRACVSADYPCDATCTTYRVERHGGDLAFDAAAPPEGAGAARVSLALRSVPGQASWYAERAGFPWPAGDATVEVWLRREGDCEAGCGVVSLGAADGGGDALGLELLGGWHARVHSAGSTSQYAPARVPRGEWHHLALVWSAAELAFAVAVDGAFSAGLPLAAAGVALALLRRRGGGALRLGQWFPEGVPDGGRAFPGLLQELRVWSAARAASALRACAESAVSSHGDLVASWPLDGDLLDAGPRLLHLTRHRRPLWDEREGYGAAARPRWRWPAAASAADCAAACGAAAGCAQWAVNSSAGGGCYGAEVATPLYAAPGATAGVSATCPGLEWGTESDGWSAFASVPSDPDPPRLWRFDQADDAASCALYCGAEAQCAEFTWVDPGYSDAATAGRCFGIGGAAVRPWVARALHRSGRGKRCRPTALAVPVPVPGESLLSARLARQLCAAAGAVPARPASGGMLLWMLKQAALGGANSTVAVGAVSPSGGPESFDATPVPMGAAVAEATSGAATRRWVLGTGPGGLASPLGAAPAAEGELWWGAAGDGSLAAWPAGGATPWLLCAVGEEQLWGHRAGPALRAPAAPVCVGDPRAAVTGGSCLGRCAHGLCLGPDGPCACDAGWYPYDDCSSFCDGALVSNGTACALPRPTLAVVTDHVAADGAVGLYRTVALHLTGTGVSTRDHVKIVRRGGRACRAVPSAAPDESATPLGALPNHDECARQVGTRGDAAFLWAAASGMCWAAPAANATLASEPATGYSGCVLADPGSDGDNLACRSRPHTAWCDEGAAHGGGLEMRGKGTVVYTATLTEEGEYVVCHRPAAARTQHPDDDFAAAGAVAVRAWSCREKRQLAPDTQCEL
eukprot:TRINITY_DN7503_c1_g3_i2.p1 TRINITY_DN7503_c1_g3~~TRINITY_DN7503_c1_g3_i2.p1  ORF type:complete len:5263 (+),score=1317.66 TRINITY_DN7503_c1_g3_i2:2040-15791(+)